jgi:hypothetical protein
LQSTVPRWSPRAGSDRQRGQRCGGVAAISFSDIERALRCDSLRELSAGERTGSIVTDADHPLTVIAFDNIGGDWRDSMCGVFIGHLLRLGPGGAFVCGSAAKHGPNCLWITARTRRVVNGQAGILHRRYKMEGASK